MSEEKSALVTVVEVFVVAVIALAIFAPQLISLATDVFVYILVDNIEGLIAGAIVGAFLGSLASKEVEVSIGGFVFTVSVGAIVGLVVQYLLFH